MPSILVDSGAKLLMYGMGELTIVQLYRELAEGKKLSEIHDIRGTCYLTEPKNTPLGAVQCDSFEIVSENKKAYAKSCRQQYDEQDEVYGKTYGTASRKYDACTESSSEKPYPERI